MVNRIARSIYSYVLRWKYMKSESWIFTGLCQLLEMRFTNNLKAPGTPAGSSLNQE